MSEISSDSRFKKNTLYSVLLFVERHTEVPEIVFEWDFADEKVAKNQYREVKRIANDLRQIEEEDSELLADQLDELAAKLKKTNK